MRFEVREDDFANTQTRALLALHLDGMRAHSPPSSVHALDLSGLQRPDMTVWTVWSEDRVAGVGALRRLDAHVGEVKSMRTHPDFLRQGVSAILLEHIIGHAKRLGLRRLSLETGSGPAFEPALALYRKRGFRNGEPFGDYAASDFNQFLHLPV